MSQYLASDDANPEFYGASNPDNRLNARFYKTAIQNNFRSEMEGRPIFEDAVMVRITIPGDDNTIIDTFARDEHKRRFPRQWQHFEANAVGDQRLAGKTPIDQWSRLTPAQVEEFRHMGFLAVEDVAFASDANIQALGMVGGMSPHALRETAKAFLRVSADTSAVQKAEAAAAKAAEESAALRDQMAAMQKAMDDRFAALANKTSAAPAGDLLPPVEEAPKGKGK